MYEFENITPTNGFDIKDLNNARQNNYAWSMAELDGYIYVGTGRNIPLLVLQSISPGIKIPSILATNGQDNGAEIWRYKKDGSLPWIRVFEAANGSGITGFRYMISDNPLNGAPALFAATFGTKARVFKSTNGVNWFEMPDTLEGTSSRAMITLRGKLYIATIDEVSGDETPLLYSSDDPEFYPWKKVIDPTKPGFEEDKNPQGAISNMVIFNNRLYVATSSSEGAMVWRTNSFEPKMNDWTLIVDHGFGDKANKYVLSMGVFKNYVYVSGTKSLPLAWAIPMGCDIIRIDKRDNWALVVGGRPLIPSKPSKGERRKSLSGLNSGFNNPFNVYAWQIQEHNDKLLISTFDDSSNMEVILTTLLANREYLENEIGEVITRIVIEAYKIVVSLLSKYHYPIGFDMFVSYNGIDFKRIVKRGLNNPNNYGGRILFVDNEDELYLGTANPFEGCEVFKAYEECDSCDQDSCYNYDYDLMNADKMMVDEFIRNFDILNKHLPLILEKLAIHK
ncbi:MAG: hypothetical protein RR620_13330 [Clostridium sp.]